MNRGDTANNSDDSIDIDAFNDIIDMGSYIGINTEGLRAYITSDPPGTEPWRTDTDSSELNRIILDIGNQLENTINFVSNLKNDYF